MTFQGHHLDLYCGADVIEIEEREFHLVAKYPDGHRFGYDLVFIYKNKANALNRCKALIGNILTARRIAANKALAKAIAHVKNEDACYTVWQQHKRLPELTSSGWEV